MTAWKTAGIAVLVVIALVLAATLAVTARESNVRLDALAFACRDYTRTLDDATGAPERTPSEKITLISNCEDHYLELAKEARQ